MTLYKLPPKAVLDACVLFPFTLRDTLLTLAENDLYRPRWSDMILDEMERALARELATTAAKASGMRRQMEKFFDNAKVEDFEHLIDSMLNDPKDRHVAAAAVQAGAEIIVTANLKDFKELPNGVRAMSPDEFLCFLLDQDQDNVIRSLVQQVEAYDDPPMTVMDVVTSLRNSVPAPNFARRLDALLP